MFFCFRREILALSNENYSLEKQLVSYQKSIGSASRSMSKDASETGSLRGTSTHQLSQRSASEMQLNDSQQQQPPQALQQQPPSQFAAGQTPSHQVAQQHSLERRSMGSGGSGSMLGLPIATTANQVSPVSPLSTTRSYHASFHQLASTRHHRSEYHHQLPAIPVQAASGHPMFGSPQIKVRQQQQAAHYGSLPANSMHDSALLDDEEFATSMTNMNQLRMARSLHRSRERTPSIGFAGVVQTAVQYGYGQSNANSYQYPAQQPNQTNGW